MIFDTRIAGIPCQCKVFAIYPAKPIYVHDKGWGYTEPPEPASFDYQILDRKGYPAPWLEKKLNDQTRYDLEEEIHMACMANKYGYEY